MRTVLQEGLRCDADDDPADVPARRPLREAGDRARSRQPARRSCRASAACPAARGRRRRRGGRPARRSPRRRTPDRYARPGPALDVRLQVDVRRAARIPPGEDSQEARLAERHSSAGGRGGSGSLRSSVSPRDPPSNPEYSPAASACQISTSAFPIGLQVFAFTIVSSRSRGVPGLPSRTSRRVSLFRCTGLPSPRGRGGRS